MSQNEEDTADGTADEEGADITGNRVVEYLRQNPEFFTDNADLLSTLMPSSRPNGDGVIDMQQFLLERLRAEIDNLRECAQDVIETSRNNMSIQSRCHAAVLALLAADNGEQFFHIINNDLPLLLDVDVVALGFEPVTPPLVDLAATDIRALENGAVDHWLGDGQNVCLLPGLDDDGTLFGAASGLVRSAALARLRPGRTVPAGLLALGSRTPGVFQPSQGTELVGFLARIMEWCIQRWLEKPA